MSASPSERLVELGLVLPPPPTPKGAYVPVVRAGKLAWVSGQIAFEQGAVVRPGTVDRDVSADVASNLVRRATLQALSALAAELGSLDRVRRAVRLGCSSPSRPASTGSTKWRTEVPSSSSPSSARPGGRAARRSVSQGFR